MKKYIEYVAVVIVALVACYFVLTPKVKLVGSSTGYDSLNLVPSAATGDTYSLAVNGTSIVDLNGNYIGVQVGVVSSTSGTFSSLTIGSGNTPLTSYKCATFNWDPAAVGSTSAAVVDVSTPGVTLVSQETIALGTTTQGLGLLASASTTATSEVTLFDPDNTAAAINIGVTTSTLCYAN